MANTITRFLLDGTEYQFQDERVDTLNAVATSGSYNDLTDTPTVDSEVTEAGANAVTGAAVASYVDTQLGVVADGSY